MRTFIFIFFIAAKCLSLPVNHLNDDINKFSPSQTDFIYLGFLKINNGDSLVWKQTDYSDSGWLYLNEYNFDRSNGNFWIRTKVNITERINYTIVPGIIPQMVVSAFEIYWDGELIGSNGKVGNSLRSEEPGDFMKRFYLKEKLYTPGTHTLAIRISNFHSGSDLRGTFVLFGSIPGIMSSISLWQLKFSFLLGIVFLGCFFSLFLYLNSKKKAYLIFSALCFVVLLSSVINLYWTISDVSTTYLDVQYLWLPVTAVLIAALLPIFFLYEFSFEAKIISLGIIIFNLLIYLTLQNSFYFYKSILYLQILSTTVIIIFAMFSRKSGSYIALSGIIASVIIYLLDLKTGVNDQTMTSVIIILFYNFHLARQFARRERTEREALLKSSRLENELLKKNINPHFILNSLTSIIAWLKKDPGIAIKLVNALADEFRIISQISNQRLIPINQELELCRLHIEIMNYRKRGQFSFITEGINEEDKIPPMIIHTLIENGITHGYENKNTGYFKLIRKEFPGGIQYSLFNDSHMINSEFREGTGYRYVRARLEESYQDKWRLDYKPVENGWEVIFEIQKN